MRFLRELGGSVSTSLGDLLLIPCQDLQAALRSNTSGQGLLPLERGVIVRALTEGASAIGFQQPDLGQTQKAEAVGAKRKMSAVIDQALDSEFVGMTEAGVRDLFNKFDRDQDGLPLAYEEPSAEQLQALKEVIAADRSPYADFAVWGPFGRRQQKLMKYNAMIWLGGELIHKQMTGPGSFLAWRKCWRVFRCAMLLLDACKAGPLDEYEERIRSLSDVYPAYWGVIARADEVMRSEEWERLRRNVESLRARSVYQHTFDTKRPWAAVIRDAARHPIYWNENVKELIAVSTSSRSSTAGVAQALNLAVAPSGSGAGASSTAQGYQAPPPSFPSGGKKGEGKRAKRGNGKQQSNRQSKNAAGVEICFMWNRSVDGCVATGPCPKGRAHQCELCLGPHRATDASCPKKPAGWKAPPRR